MHRNAGTPSWGTPSPAVQYYTASTLDGFIADEHHSLDWLFQFGESATDDYPEFIANVGAAVMGSSTYEWILAHMERTNEPWPYTQPIWVFTTRTLPRPEGADIRFARGDVAFVFHEIAKAAGDKNVWLVGGGDLARQFYERGLLNELIVTIASVTLGRGKPLLPGAIVTPPLVLRSARTFGTAFVQLRYDVQLPFYHGTRAELKPGDLLAPGYRPNFGNRERTTTWIYFAASLDAAIWGAELASGEGAGRIYIVEPTGEFEDDPNLTDKKFPGNPTRSYRSREALRVIREYTGWQPHPPEVLQAMKDGIARLEQAGVEPIDD